MDSLQDILNTYAAPDEPELTAIKRYVEERYHTPIHTALHGNVIVVTVPSAALAATLRMQTPQIQKECNLSRRIIFRIG